MELATALVWQENGRRATEEFRLGSVPVTYNYR